MCNLSDMADFVGGKPVRDHDLAITVGYHRTGEFYWFVGPHGCLLPSPTVEVAVTKIIGNWPFQIGQKKRKEMKHCQRHKLTLTHKCFDLIQKHSFTKLTLLPAGWVSAVSKNGRMCYWLYSATVGSQNFWKITILSVSLCCYHIPGKSQKYFGTVLFRSCYVALAMKYYHIPTIISIRKLYLLWYLLTVV